MSDLFEISNREEVLDFLDLDDDERNDYKIEWHDEYRYVLFRDDYCKKLISIYDDAVDERKSEYAEKAERISADFEREISFEKDEMPI